jgi:hypothetical protein
MIYLPVVLCYLSLEFIEFLHSVIYSFQQIWKNFNHYVCKSVFCPKPPSQDSWNVCNISACVVPQVTGALFSFFFFCAFQFGYFVDNFVFKLIDLVLKLINAFLFACLSDNQCADDEYIYHILHFTFFFFISRKF